MRSRSWSRADVWIKAVLALELIWTVAGAGVFLARSARPTAEAAIAFLREHNIANLPTADREKIMRKAATQLNRLSFDQMRVVRESRALFAFYWVLEPQEKERFAAMIMPTGLRRIVYASREVPPDQRAEFLQKTLYLAVIDFSTADPPIDPAALDRVEREALKSFTDSLGAEERIELAPQLRQVRKYLYPDE